MAPRDDRFPVLAQIDGRLMVARVESGSGWMDLGPVRWPHGKWLLFAPARAIWVGCLSAEAGFVCWPLSGR
jgi:hypothetical protein